MDTGFATCWATYGNGAPIPYLPNASLLSSLDPKNSAALEKSLPDAPDRAVRGGSWADQPGADKVYTRGAQPAEWCTPYLGFRVALARQ